MKITAERYNYINQKNKNAPTFGVNLDDKALDVLKSNLQRNKVTPEGVNSVITLLKSPLQQERISHIKLNSGKEPTVSILPFNKLDPSKMISISVSNGPMFVQTEFFIDTFMGKNHTPETIVKRFINAMEQGRNHLDYHQKPTLLTQLFGNLFETLKRA